MKPTKEYNGRSRIRMYNCDCMDFMEDCDKYDLAIVDPPYGIEKKISTGGGSHTKSKVKFHQRYKENGKNWDNKRPDKYYWKALFDSSDNQIVFGGNYFCENLPISRGWAFWDKQGKNMTTVNDELIWTSFDVSIKTFSRCHGMDKGFMADHKVFHPTTKPVQLYKWLLKNYGTECKNCKGEGSYYEDVAGDGGSKMLMHCDICDGSGNGTILDTHGGSLSIAIACWDLGFDLDVCELDTDYFNDAVKRFEQHISQAQLF